MVLETLDRCVKRKKEKLDHLLYTRINSKWYVAGLISQTVLDFGDLDCLED